MAPIMAFHVSDLRRVIEVIWYKNRRRRPIILSKQNGRHSSEGPAQRAPKLIFVWSTHYYELVSVERVELSVFGYATEDPQKVAACLSTLLGLPQEKVFATKAKGHYGDEISVFSVTIDGAEAEACAKKIFSLMNQENLRRILDTIDMRFDGSRLFLRISKFDACLGQAALMDGGDTIKVVIKFKGYLKGKKPLQILEESGLVGEKDA